MSRDDTIRFKDKRTFGAVVRKALAKAEGGAQDARAWDTNSPGLFLRVKPPSARHPQGSKTFFLQFTSPEDHKKRRARIGRYGRDLTLEQARKEASGMRDAIRGGVDPVLSAALLKAQAVANIRTVKALCDDYMADARAGRVMYRGRPKKESTLATDQGRVERHIIPLLGKRLVSSITPDDVAAFFHDVRMGKTAATIKTNARGGVARVRGGAGTARRTVGLFGGIMSYAVRQKLLDRNPVTGFERGNDRRRSRILSPKEYRTLGKTLDALDAEGANRAATLAARVLAATGCRKGEVYGLPKAAVDQHAQCFRFEDTKTGQQVRPFGSVALHLIAKALVLQDKDDEDAEPSPYVFPASRGDGHLSDVRLFSEACERAKLEGVTLHVLRHSFASVALELEYSEMTVAALLGHRLASVTSRYSHHVDKALVTAADRVAALIWRRMTGEATGGADVVRLKAG